MIKMSANSDRVMTAGESARRGGCSSGCKAAGNKVKRFRSAKIINMMSVAMTTRASSPMKMSAWLKIAAGFFFFMKDTAHALHNRGEGFSRHQHDKKYKYEFDPLSTVY